jgi:AcrR family transcriptional regulator
MKAHNMSNNPSTNRASRREVRRNQLVDAALAVFSTHGVAAASVDDIVQAAGVAKGTFYLYFRTKDDAVNAVAERMVNRVSDRVEVAANNADLSAIDQLLALGSALQDIGTEPYERDLVEIFHRPENRAVHDRISERILARLAPALRCIIADGIAAGLFRPQDPRLAAAFVLGSLTLLHHVVSDPDRMPAATTQLETFVLRGLGYAGEIDP